MPDAPFTRDEARSLDFIPALGSEIAALGATPPPALLAPILAAGGLVLLHGPRGIGLTQVVTGCAAALAAGGAFLGWRAPEARRVLLLTGGLSLASLAQRLNAALALQPPDTSATDRLLALTAEQQGGLVHDLADEATQQGLMPLLLKVDVLMIDGPAALLSGAARDPAGSLRRLRSWLLHLRRMGKGVVLAQADAPRSRRAAYWVLRHCTTELADTVIGLGRPDDYRPEQGARFDVQIERAGLIDGPARRPFQAWLASDSDGQPAWKIVVRDELCRAQFLELVNDGMPEPLAREQLGISRTSAWRWRRDARRARTTPGT